MPGKKLTAQQLAAIQQYKQDFINSLGDMAESQGLPFNREMGSESLLSLFQNGDIRKQDGTRYRKDISLDEIIYELWERENQLKEREEYKKTQWTVGKFSAEHVDSLQDDLLGIYLPLEGSKEYERFHNIADTIFNKAQSEMQNSALLEEDDEEETKSFSVNKKDLDALIEADKQLTDAARNRSFVIKTAGEVYRGVKVSLTDNDSVKVKAEATEEKIELDNDLISYNGILKTAVNDLLDDLKATDSVFSRDSREYKNFKSALTQLSEKLEKTAVASASDLANIFNTKFKTGSKDGEERSVLDCADAYLGAKRAKEGDLSNRQIDRISICERFKTLHSLAKITSRTESELKAFPKVVQTDTVAHKTFLAALKKGESDKLNQVFKNKNDCTKHRKDYMKKHHYAFQRFLNSDKYTPEQLREIARKPIDKILPLETKEEIRDNEVYDFLKDRTEVLADRFGKNKTKDDIEFRKALNTLQEDFKNIEADHSPEKMKEVMGKIYTAAENYTKSAYDDYLKNRTIDPDKLEIATELKIHANTVYSEDVSFNRVLTELFCFQTARDRIVNVVNDKDTEEALDTYAEFLSSNKKTVQVTNHLKKLMTSGHETAADYGVFAYDLENQPQKTMHREYVNLKGDKPINPHLPYIVKKNHDEKVHKKEQAGAVINK